MTWIEPRPSSQSTKGLTLTSDTQRATQTGTPLSSAQASEDDSTQSTTILPATVKTVTKIISDHQRLLLEQLSRQLSEQALTTLKEQLNDQASNIKGLFEIIAQPQAQTTPVKFITDLLLMPGQSLMLALGLTSTSTAQSEAAANHHWVQDFWFEPTTAKHQDQTLRRNWLNQQLPHQNLLALVSDTQEASSAATTNNQHIQAKHLAALTRLIPQLATELKQTPENYVTKASHLKTQITHFHQARLKLLYQLTQSAQTLPELGTAAQAKLQNLLNWLQAAQSATINVQTLNQITQSLSSNAEQDSWLSQLHHLLMKHWPEYRQASRILTDHTSAHSQQLIQHVKDARFTPQTLIDPSSVAVQSTRLQDDLLALLIRATVGSLSRTYLQWNSQAPDLSEDPRKIIIQEVPVEFDHRVDVVTFSVEKQSNKHKQKSNINSWTVFLDFSLEKLGPVSIEFTLDQEHRAKTRIYAESEHTREKIRHAKKTLTQRFEAMGIELTGFALQRVPLKKPKALKRSQLIDLHT